MNTDLFLVQNVERGEFYISPPSTLVYTSALVVCPLLKWADCPNSRCSTSSYSIFLSDNLVSWSSKWQRVYPIPVQRWSIGLLYMQFVMTGVTATPGPAQWLDHVAGYGLGAPNRWFCSLP